MRKKAGVVKKARKPPSQVGDIYGRLTIVELLGLRPRVSGRGQESWALVECSCADRTRKEVRIYCLRSENTKSCGCLARETFIARNTKHGEYKTKLYMHWAGMKSRCEQPSGRSWHRYGGRGISVCPEWRDDFMVFRAWALDNGYVEGKELDRIDNNLGYSPDNCRWLTKLENLENRSKYLPQELEIWLRNYSAEVGCSPHEIIKRALEFHLGLSRTATESDENL